MNRQLQLAGLLSFLLAFFVPACFAQDEDSNQAAESQNTEVPAGQEVEVNEDNYRQFMELKDARGQRNMLPENAFKPRSGTQKLDKLPEESQKHLRNQLREIIVQGDQWQPGDENSQYPYVPSTAASSDTSLQKQEAEAWGELMDNYHQREAEIYENSARTQAAMATGSASGSNGGSSGAESGQGGAGQGGEGQESSQPSRGEQGGAADSYSPNAQNDPNASGSQGVSQNAMEFLTGKGQQMARAGESNSTAATASQNSNPRQNANQAAEAQQQDQQQQDQPANKPIESTIVSVEDQQTGARQNALEYLTGGQNQDKQADGNSPGTEPLPQLPSLTEPTPASSADTLTIQDLLNAQGVRNAPGAGSPAPGAIRGPISDDDDPEKDGEG